MNNLLRACSIMAVLAVPPFALAQAEETWEVPRTSYGHPVLQGYWTNATFVPLQRPEELGEQAFYTPEEAEAFLEERLQPRETERGTAADVHYQFEDYALGRSYNEVVENLRTSIITDPPDGRLPPVTEEAERLAAEYNEYRREHGFDSAQDRSLSARCIVWSSEGPPILPLGYNSNLQIMQTEDYVVIITEMIHDARVVPLEGSGVEPVNVPQWLGNSKARWEGDTLVVETTGFSGRTNARGINAPMTQDARVVERLTRTGPDTIKYEFTVDEPEVWTQSWSGEYPMKSIDGPMFEYACHEGNYGLANNLRGARAEERREAEQAAQEQEE